MAKLDEKQTQFLEQPFVGVVTTLREDGSPHNTVVWVDVDDGADPQIDKLAKKYLGVDEYPYRNAAEQRLKVRIAPEHITAVGLDG